MATPEPGVSRLGAGVVIHTRPGTDQRMAIVVGYADGRGQWYRDGRRHSEPRAEEATRPANGVAL